MDLNLEGKVAIVTGASKGIGSGVAKILAKERCQLVIVARRREPLDIVAEEILAAGGRPPLIITEDITLPQSAELVCSKVEAQLGGIDILVNCAGGSRPVPWDCDFATWDEGMRLNFDSLRLMSIAAVKRMAPNNWGRVISVTGTSEPRRMNVATAAKAAAHAWFKMLSKDVGRQGVTVNCVDPGIVRSEQLDRVFSPGELETYIENTLSLGHLGEPEDPAAIIAFLASPKARWITGAVIAADGGRRRYAF